MPHRRVYTITTARNVCAVVMPSACTSVERWCVRTIARCQQSAHSDAQVYRRHWRCDSLHETCNPNVSAMVNGSRAIAHSSYDGCFVIFYCVFIIRTLAECTACSDYQFMSILMYFSYQRRVFDAIFCISGIQFKSRLHIVFIWASLMSADFQWDSHTSYRLTVFKSFELSICELNVPMRYSRMLWKVQITFIPTSLNTRVNSRVIYLCLLHLNDRKKQ